MEVKKSKYCEVIQKKIVSLKGDRAFYLKRIEETKKMNEDVVLTLKIIPSANIYLDNEINVDWAVKSIGEVKEVLRAFAKEGIMLDRFYEDEANPIWYLKTKSGIMIRLKPTWYRDGEQAEGVTCKLVQVGVTTSTYPKYRLICSDGSEPDKTAE